MSVSMAKGKPVIRTTAGLQALKIIVLVLIGFALGFAVFFCVTKVGDLHSRAAVLQSCLDSEKNSVPMSTGCPTTPVSATQISVLLDEAKTLGDLGWISFLIGIFVVGGTVMDILKE
jgi:hypothetical protein